MERATAYGTREAILVRDPIFVMGECLCGDVLRVDHERNVVQNRHAHSILAVRNIRLGGAHDEQFGRRLRIVYRRDN